MNPLLLSQVYEFVQSKNPVFAIKGKAGTGKTQLIKEISAALDRNSYKVAVLTPTNKAAIVLNKRGIKAKTIHSQMYRSVVRVDPDGNPVTKTTNKPIFNPLKPKEFLLDENGDIRYNVTEENLYDFVFSPKLDSSTIIIIDESSMVAAQEWSNLLNKTSFKIIAVGDVNQLEPVSTNLKDLRSLLDNYDDTEKNEYTPDELYNKFIEEQSLQNKYGQYFIKLIVNWEEKINHRTNNNSIKQVFESLLTDRESRWPLPLYDPFAHILDKDEVPVNLVNEFLESVNIVIAHKNDTVDMLNNRIRELKYPSIFQRLKGMGSALPYPGKTEPLYVNNTFYISEDPGDGMVQKGETIRIVGDNKTLDTKNKILYATVQVESSGEIFDNFPLRLNLCGERTNKKLKSCNVSFGYAITCHKSQGSQWDRVLVWDDCTLFGEQKRRWRYTACTRSVSSLTVLVQGKN